MGLVSRDGLGWGDYAWQLTSAGQLLVWSFARLLATRLQLLNSVVEQLEGLRVVGKKVGR
jgi:hypothetical protein